MDPLGASRGWAKLQINVPDRGEVDPNRQPANGAVCTVDDGSSQPPSSGNTAGAQTPRSNGNAQ